MFVLCSVSRDSYVQGSCLFTLNTTIVCICRETGGTEFTESFVVLDNAWGVSRTCFAFTRVLALVVDAGLASWTSSVFQANGD